MKFSKPFGFVVLSEKLVKMFLYSIVFQLFVVFY